MKLRSDFRIKRSKFAEQALGSFVVSLCSGLFCRKKSQVHALAIHLNPGVPAVPLARKGHALEAAGVVRSNATHVAEILRNRCRTKIAPAVVQAISIAMVKILIWLRAYDQAVHQDFWAVPTTHVSSSSRVNHRLTAFESVPTVLQNSGCIFDIDQRPVTRVQRDFYSSESHGLQNLKRVHARQSSHFLAVEECEKAGMLA